MSHAGLSHALFTSNPYLLGLSTSDRAGCAVRCAAELFLNALESNATEVRVEVSMFHSKRPTWWPRARETRRGAFSFFRVSSFESKCTRRSAQRIRKGIFRRLQLSEPTKAPSTR